MACSSGSAALHIAVAALRLEPGSEIIVPAITDMGSVIGILYQQLVPVFADVDGETYNLDPVDVRRRITAKTRAIMPVSLYGQVAELGTINEIAAKHGLPVIEDAAQSFGKILGDLRNPRIDLISVRGHKIYGPKGVGALVVRRRGFHRPPEDIP